MKSLTENGFLSIYLNRFIKLMLLNRSSCAAPWLLIPMGVCSVTMRAIAVIREFKMDWKVLATVRMMSIIAGSGFVLIGLWTLYHGLYQAQ
jgi:hypothetical protein